MYFTIKILILSLLWLRLDIYFDTFCSTFNALNISFWMTWAVLIQKKCIVCSFCFFVFYYHILIFACICINVLRKHDDFWYLIGRSKSIILYMPWIICIVSLWLAIVSFFFNHRFKNYQELCWFLRKIQFFCFASFYYINQTEVRLLREFFFDEILINILIRM